MDEDGIDELGIADDIELELDIGVLEGTTRVSVEVTADIGAYQWLEEHRTC